MVLRLRCASSAESGDSVTTESEEVILSRSPSAETLRMRRSRAPRRDGMRHMTIELHETEIDALIRKGFFTEDARNERRTVMSANSSGRKGATSETRKLAAILVADVVGYSRLAGADEDRILARLRTLRSDLIDPTIAVHHGQIVKRTGDGAIVEFRSVVDAVRCAIEVQSGLAERNAGLPPEKRIELRVGIHLGDVVEETDGDLMGDGVNIAARLEGIAKAGAICLSEQAYWQVKGRLDLNVNDLGHTELKNIAEPIHVYSLDVGQPTEAKPASSATPADQSKSVRSKLRLRSAWLPVALTALLILAAAGGGYALGGRNVKPSELAHLSIGVLPFTNISGDPPQDYFADGATQNLATELSRIRDSFVIARNTAFTSKGNSIDRCFEWNCLRLLF
jgi:adenylate cyclase